MLDVVEGTWSSSSTSRRWRRWWGARRAGRRPDRRTGAGSPCGTRRAGTGRCGCMAQAVDTGRVPDSDCEARTWTERALQRMRRPGQWTIGPGLGAGGAPSRWRLALAPSATGWSPQEGAMPGGRGRPVRSCYLCKPGKFAGNGSERWKPKEAARRTAMDQEARGGSIRPPPTDQGRATLADSPTFA